MPPLTVIDAQPAYDWLGVRDYQPGDVDEKTAIFILGAGSTGPAREAAEIFLDATVNSPIFFTSAGGRFGGNVVFGRQEFEEYASILHKYRVPEEYIHYPSDDLKHTTNTLMEAKGAIPFIRSHMDNVRRVILCSRPVHQRRALATFRKHYPDIEYVNAPCSELLTTEHLLRIVQEVDRLKEYGAKGDLEVQIIPKHVTEICEQLRVYLAALPA
jgi:uncharacterized SAM-binding protein YcdF (DUF218 family)